jgi:hypothetical protein
VNSIFKGFAIVWVINAAAGLAVTCAIGYVAWHFISKFW